MKKEWKRVNGIFLMLLLIVSFFAVLVLNTHFVSADPTLAEQVAGQFSNFFSNWVSGAGISENAAKILFLVMIMLILMLVFNSLFTGFNQTIIFVLSLIVSFLATAYITPGEIFAILQSYSALGLTLGSLIPFAVLLALTYRAATATSGAVQLWMLQKFAWIFFALYSLYKLGSYPFTSGTVAWTGNILTYLKDLVQSNPIIIVLLFVTVIAAIMAIWDRWVLRWIARSYLLGLGDNARNVAEAAARQNVILADELAAMGGVRGRPRRP